MDLWNSCMGKQRQRANTTSLDSNHRNKRHSEQELSMARGDIRDEDRTERCRNTNCPREN